MGLEHPCRRNAVQQEEAVKLFQNYSRIWEQIFIFSLTKTRVYKKRESLPGRGVEFLPPTSGMLIYELCSKEMEMLH